MGIVKSDSILGNKVHILFISVFFILLFASLSYAREITLTWDPNSEPDLDHYVVYWGVDPGDYTVNSGDIGLVNEYSVQIPDDGQVYFFAVTAVNDSGLESGFSNEVSTEKLQAISFGSNWNLVSIPNDQTTAPIEEILAPVLDDIISVWAFQDGTWLFYDPKDPGSSTLFDVEPGQGLWVNMNKNTELFIPEGQLPNNAVDLMTGWNLVGFNSFTPQDISTAISSIANKVISIWAYEDGEWKVYDPQNPGFSDLTTMKPGSGYWIKVSDQCSWVR